MNCRISFDERRFCCFMLGDLKKIPIDENPPDIWDYYRTNPPANVYIYEHIKNY